jgi:hypothetical protein
LDTNGNVFGGFTPVEWESRTRDRGDHLCFKADDSLRSFLFTLKNPHNIAARRFALMEEKKQLAMYCYCGWGPSLGAGLAVCDNCNNNENATNLGLAYTNDTGLKGETVFTGSFNFQVKEIEVFEIIE